MSPHSRRLLVCLLATLTSLYVVTAANFSLVILHIGNMGSNFEQTSRVGGICSPEEAANKSCYGGFARIAHKVKEMKNLAKEKKGPPVIFLTAGNTFMGTTLYVVHRWKIVVKLTNMLGIDAAAIGNREFDDGVDGLAPFLNRTNYPVVASNIDVSEEPKLQATPLKKSTILTIDNRKIGIVGYINAETKSLSQTGEVFFRHETQSVYQEAAALKEQGVDIIIALGNAKWDTDLNIAHEVADVDVLVAASTGIFLYTGESPDSRFTVKDVYPYVVNNSVSGTHVPVVYAARDTKFLGMLHVTFDDKGKAIEWKGNPIYLDNQIEEDPAVLEELGSWQKEVDEYNNMLVGMSRVNLYTSCRMVECNMANMITDAIFDKYAKISQSPENGWSKASIAILNSGSVKYLEFDAFQEQKGTNGTLPLGTVSWSYLTATVPYDSQICMVTLKGKKLLKALEWSAFARGHEIFSGAFLQFSGLRVNYDMCKAEGQRVTSVQMRCTHCMVPTYIPFDLDEEYVVLVTVYMAKGGDKYTLFEDSVAYEVLNYTLHTCMQDYFAAMSPVYPRLEDRVTFSPTNCTAEKFLIARAPRIILSHWQLLVPCLVLVLSAASWRSM